MVHTYVAVSNKSAIDSVLRSFVCQFAVHQTAVLCGARLSYSYICTSV